MGRDQIEYTGIDEMGFLYSIADDVIFYTNWYAENGISLPLEYQKDPAAWTQKLRDVQAAFEIVKRMVLPEELTPEDKKLFEDGIECFYTNLKHFWK